MTLRRVPSPAGGLSIGGNGVDGAPTAAVLVPVKAFSAAKARLAPVLGPSEREALARNMAATVLAAAAPLPVAVVCDDRLVARWALARGAEVVWTPGQGLNRAVGTGVRSLWGAGAERVIVAHADLPLVPPLAGMADFDGVTLAPDSRGDGTNVICVPAGCGFGFSYGPGSFRRHRREARRLGLEVRVVTEPGMALDIDHPADLATADLATADLATADLATADLATADLALAGQAAPRPARGANP